MKRALNAFVYVVMAVPFVLATLTANPANGQVSKGSISGAVVDAQGAAVGSATVKVTSKGTNQEFSTTSDSAGLFRLSLLPPESYRLEVSKQGFRKIVIDEVNVVVGADFGVGNIKLEVGEVTATVEVSSTLPLLESTEAQITNAFTPEKIEAFPGVLENQGLDKLALTVPGVVNNRGLSFSNTNGTGFAVNGIRGRNNDQQIDGQNNNDNSVGGPGLFVSDPEFVQEYQITTSNFGAEYGRNSGSVVNIITKSGTNNFHGSIFGTESNSALDALSNTQKAFEGLKKPARYNDEFTGGTIGGPIRRDHLFFFGGFDDEIVSQQQVYTSGNDTTAPLTPTPAGIATMLTCFGNTNSMQALQTYGPFAIKGGNPTSVPGTITTLSLTNAMNQSLCTDGVLRSVELSQVERTLSTGSKSYDFPIRLDLQTAKNQFYGRYLYNKSTLFNADSFATAAAGYPNNVPALSQDYGFSWVRTLSPRMSNEFRASYGRLNVEFGGNSIGNTIPDQGSIGQAIARISFSAPNSLGFGPATNAPQGRIVNTYQVQDNWNYSLGRNGLKAGVNFTYQRSPNIFLPNFNGSYRFSNWGTFGLDTPNRIQIAQGSPSLDFREKDTFVYFGDDFKIKNNLTLNLGITWSYYGQPANLFHQITIKNQSGSNPLWNPAVPTSATIFPEIPAPKNSWGPSVGFAWTPSGGGLITGRGKTVLRGGYRLAYDPPFYNIYVNISSAAPIVFLQTLSATSTPIGTHNLPANPTGPNVRADLAPALVRGAFDPRTFNDTSITPNFGPQRTHEWSFGLQRELKAGAVFEARYVGNRGTNLYQSVNGNPRIDGLLAAFPNLVPSGLTPCTTPTTILGPGQTTHPELGRVDCNQGIVRRRTNSAYSDYHGLQLEVRGNQLAHQLTLKSGYTFSKTTDNATEIFTPGSSIAPAFAQSQVNFTNQEHGISSLNFRHNWSVTFTEEIPVFRTQQGITGHVLGGWAISGSYFIVSGQPYTPWQNSLNCFPVTGPSCFATPASSSYYDLPFTNAFIGTDQSLRPFLGNSAAPVTTVGIFAGDGCHVDESGNLCGNSAITATTLISLNGINNGLTGVMPDPVNKGKFLPDPTHAAVVVTNKDVRFIANTRTANTVFGSPFGNVGRNVLNDAMTNIGNFELFKTVSVKERLKVTWHMSMLNVFNHPNFFSVDPFVDDAGLAQEGSGFANPSLTSGGIRGGGATGNPGRSIRFGLKIAF